MPHHTLDGAVLQHKMHNLCWVRSKDQITDFHWFYKVEFQAAFSKCHIQGLASQWAFQTCGARLDKNCWTKSGKFWAMWPGNQGNQRWASLSGDQEADNGCCFEILGVERRNWVDLCHKQSEYEITLILPGFTPGPAGRQRAWDRAAHGRVEQRTGELQQLTNLFGPAKPISNSRCWANPPSYWKSGCCETRGC